MNRQVFLEISLWKNGTKVVASWDVATPGFINPSKSRPRRVMEFVGSLVPDEPKIFGTCQQVNGWFVGLASSAILLFNLGSLLGLTFALFQFLNGRPLSAIGGLLFAIVSITITRRLWASYMFNSKLEQEAFIHELSEHFECEVIDLPEIVPGNMELDLMKERNDGL